MATVKFETVKVESKTVTLRFKRDLVLAGVSYAADDPVPFGVVEKHRIEVLQRTGYIYTAEQALESSVAMRMKPSRKRTPAAKAASSAPTKKEKDAKQTVIKADTNGPGSDGLYPCRFKGCKRRLNGVGARTRHENSH